MATQEITRPLIPHRNPYAETSQQIEDFSWEAWEELLIKAALEALEEDTLTEAQQKVFSER